MIGWMDNSPELSPSIDPREVISETMHLDTNVLTSKIGRNRLRSMFLGAQHMDDCRSKLQHGSAHQAAIGGELHQPMNRERN